MTGIVRARCKRTQLIGLHRLLLTLAAFCVMTSALAGCAVRIGQQPAPTVTIVPGGISTPIKVRQLGGATVVQIEVTIDGQGPYTFVLDTGASTSAIDSSLARRLGLPQAGPPHEVSGIGGSVEAVPVTLSNWSAGPIHLPAGSVDSAPLGLRQLDGSSGLLGSDILSQFGAVTIDYSAQTLTVYRQIA
jgi:Aspartyl protease